MVSESRALTYSRNQAQVVALAHRELEAFWSTLDLSKPTAAKALLADFMVTLVDAYGPISGVIAADFYDEMREESGQAGSFSAQLGPDTDPEQVRGSSDWAAQPLFDETPDQKAALHRFLGSTQRLVQEQGRQTIMLSVELDPAKPRWARMPIGDTCDWCVMLASRGADYTSRASAVSKSNGGAFHDECDCQPVVIWDGDTLPYDQQKYLDEYLANTAPKAKTKNGEPASQGGFTSLTRAQIENHLRVTEPLPDSAWRTKQLARLRARLKELS